MTCTPADPPCPVTIVAHHVGRVGGMERVLSELALGLRRHGHEVTVIAHACELPAGSGVRFHRVRGPSRPFLIGYPWFLLAGSLAVRRRRARGRPGDGSDRRQSRRRDRVHYCHQVGVVTPSRANWLYRAHVRAMGLLSRVGERLMLPREHLSDVRVRVRGRRRGDPRATTPGPPSASSRSTTASTPSALRPARTPSRRARCARRWASRAERLVAVFVGSEWKRKGLASRRSRRSRSRPSGISSSPAGGDEAHYRELARSLGVGERVHWLGVERDVQVVYALADAFCCPRATRRSRSSLRGGRERAAGPGHARERRARADRRRASTAYLITTDQRS